MSQYQIVMNGGVKILRPKIKKKKKKINNDNMKKKGF